MQNLDKVMFPVPITHREKTPSDGQEGGCCLPSPTHQEVGSAQKHISQTVDEGRGFQGTREKHQIFPQSLSLCVATDQAPEKREK